jgi:hypothetical protein
VEGAAVQHVCTESLTMIFLNILLIAGIIGLLCWLVFTLAVYALPLFVGATVGIWVHGSGAGAVGGFILGVLVAGAIATILQLIFAFARPMWIRLIVAALFVGTGSSCGLCRHTWDRDAPHALRRLADRVLAFLALSPSVPQRCFEWPEQPRWCPVWSARTGHSRQVLPGGGGGSSSTVRAESPVGG